jgi:hypothetical protein
MEQATTAGREPIFLPIDQPFSGFDYIEKTFGDYSPIRRLFSQARCLGTRSIVSEKIDAAGLIAEENDEIKRIYPDHVMDDLRRLTFWSEPLGSQGDLAKVSSANCLGYALLKQDSTLGRKWKWHVFEAVMWPTKFAYSYVPGWRVFEFRCCDRTFQIPGVLYCQQNGLNKACAQVALRSLCSLQVEPAAVSFRRINDIAAKVTGPFDTSQGLEVRQIRAVLEEFNIPFTDFDYNTLAPEDRPAYAYQKFVYAGIESGAGAMLGFKLVGPEATGHHIIPFFGHTFNRDTWVPNAEAAYFHIGDETRYIPSESWVSTFIGHDDNFGSNYAVPRLYITADQAQYVVSLHPRFVRYSGVEAEAVAVNMLYSLRKRFIPIDLSWHRRALDAIDTQKVVLRPLAMSRELYVEHLRKSRDWQDTRESNEVCDSLSGTLPEQLWLVELSVPELFPANLRKIGEILLNASIEIADDGDNEGEAFILARLPGSYIVADGVDADGTPKFRLGPSELKSHTQLYVNKQPAWEVA